MPTALGQGPWTSCNETITNVSVQTSKIRLNPLFDGLDDDSIDRVLASCFHVYLKGGDFAVRQDETGESMYWVDEGRLKVVENSTDVRGYLGPGDHFGELAMLVDGRRTASVIALTPCQLLEIRRADFDQLVRTVPVLAANLCRWMGQWVQKSMGRQTELIRPGIVSILRTTPMTQPLALTLAQTLGTPEQPVAVLSDRPHVWKSSPCYRLCGLPDLANEPERASQLHQQLHLWVAEKRQAILDMQLQSLWPDWLRSSDEIWLMVEPDSFSQVEKAVMDLVERHHFVESKLHLIWCHFSNHRLPPRVAHRLKVKNREMRVAWRPGLNGEPRLMPRDLSRLRHRLMGIQFGLTLSSGGARGMSHIGALRALERAGIYPDVMSGCSMGAIVGAFYAAGYNSYEIEEIFNQTVVPPAFVPYLPQGNSWYFWVNLKFQVIQQKLARYLFNYRFNELIVPLKTLCVDLVEGDEVIRGDQDLVVPAVCESANVPGMGDPLYRDGQALVDGCVLNSLPVNILRDQHVNFIMGITVSKIPKQFGNITASTPRQQMKPVGIFGQIFRIIEIATNKNDMRLMDVADEMITIDCRTFPIDDFTNLKPLIEKGEQTMEREISMLKQRMAKVYAYPWRTA